MQIRKPKKKSLFEKFEDYLATDKGFWTFFIGFIVFEGVLLYIVAMKGS